MKKVQEGGGSNKSVGGRQIEEKKEAIETIEEKRDV